MNNNTELTNGYTNDLDVLVNIPKKGLRELLNGADYNVDPDTITVMLDDLNLEYDLQSDDTIRLAVIDGITSPSYVSEWNSIIAKNEAEIVEIMKEVA